MSIEVLPNGVKCSLSCIYCYQQPMRDVGNFSPKKDVSAILKRLESVNAPFSIFGGEPLLTPLDELEQYFEIGLRRFNQNGVQTSLSYMKDEHWELFKKYNVHVGVSIDGPGILNSPRCGMEMTNEINSRFRKLLSDGYQTSLITTLHKENSREDRLPVLLDWFLDLSKRGLKHARLHALEVDKSEAAHLRLTEDELFNALISIEELGTNIQFDLLSEMKRLLAGDKFDASCIWNGCDPYTTPAVQGILADGTMANCGRTNKDGTNWQKAEKIGNERLLALYNTPEEYNGCKGCRFFFACKGECPGQSQDWRERTEHCGLLKRIFGHLEDRLLAENKEPISLRGDVEDFNKIVINPGHHGDHFDSPGFIVPVLNRP